MELEFQALIALFIVLSYLWTIWYLKMARVSEEKKSILVTSRYLYTLILIFIWYIQLFKHNTIIYWRIVELFKQSKQFNS